MTTTVLCYLWKNICSCPAARQAGRQALAAAGRCVRSRGGARPPACACKYTAAWPPWHMSGCKEENGELIIVAVAVAAAAAASVKRSLTHSPKAIRS